MMGFSRINPNSPYLGLPLFRSGRTRDFSFLLENLDSKLAGWKAKTLSRAKKLILINSNNGKTLCLKAWDDLCKPKACGGFGFRKMIEFNKDLLAKWSWNLLVGNRSLCLDTLRSRYLHSTNFSEATPSRGDSCFWKTILQMRCLLDDGACYVVGDGCSIDPWKDPWVLNIANFRP
ncbi:hypothetical protein UlMin_019595 [Ulmus minor]